MTLNRKFAHDVRNGLNTMLLNVQCLPISTPDETIECLDAILIAGDSIISLMYELEALPDETPVA